MSTQQETTVEIVNLAGMHARPASEFVKLAGAFTCEIFVTKDGLRVNGKSIMGVLMLAAEKGSSLTIHADGEDADRALAELSALVSSGFQED